jgi:hypothetical protein
MYRFKDGISDSTDDGFVFHMVSECDNLVIGVYPVIFGFRVRAGFKNDYSYGIDYCCGNSKGDVELIFSVVKNIIEQRSENPFAGFPRQDMKPFMKNKTEFKQLIGMIDKPSYQRVLLPDIHSIKRDYLSNHFGYTALYQTLFDRK